MDVVKMVSHRDLVEKIRDTAPSAGRRAVLLVNWVPDPGEQERLAPDLGVSRRMVIKARRALGDEELGPQVLRGDVTLDAAENRLRVRSTRSLGHEALAALASRIEVVSSQTSRRALEIIALERDGTLPGRDVFALAHMLGVNNTALLRARRAIASGTATSVVSGARSLNDASRSGGFRAGQDELPVRVDASWVGREVSKKLVTALDTISELPQAGDVADLLREHSNVSRDQLDRAINWLGELRRAFR